MTRDEETADGYDGPEDLLDEKHLTLVLGEVYAERFQQEAKWGQQNHADGTDVNWVDHIRPGFGWEGPPARHAANMARAACKRAARDGKDTWLWILLEEVAEAFAESDPAALRAELVQVAAVAVAWAQAIDRRTQLAAVPS